MIIIVQRLYAEYYNITMLFFSKQTTPTTTKKKNIDENNMNSKGKLHVQL